MSERCWTCGMMVLNGEQHYKWCHWKPPQTQLDKGTWYQSAVSGLWYENRNAAGDVAAVKIDGTMYVPPQDGHQRGGNYVVPVIVVGIPTITQLMQGLDVETSYGRLIPDSVLHSAAKHTARADPAVPPPASNATTEQRAWNMGTLAQAALRLDQYLRENVGETADWPIHLHADNVADADQLAAHLSDFSRACRDYRRDAAGQVQP